MPDEITFLNTLIAQFGANGVLYGLVIFWLWKKGALKNVLNGNGHEIKELKEEMTIMRDNHIHEITEKLDKLIEKEIEGNLLTKEVLIILQNERRN